jgi:glucose-6-phosphate 1-dehydrogenase
VPLARYSAGSDGPKEAEEMLNERGHHWKPLD